MIEMADADILPYSLEHNFWTWSAQAKVKPIPIKSAKGVYFWAVNGKKYLDLNSMVMCANIGHGDERVIQAMIDQARELPFAGPQFATKPRAMLGKKLAEILPEGLTKYLYTLGGAAPRKRGETGAPCRRIKYSPLSLIPGATFGAAALTGDPRQAWEPAVMPGVVHFLAVSISFHFISAQMSMKTSSRVITYRKKIIQYEA